MNHLKILMLGLVAAGVAVGVNFGYLVAFAGAGNAFALQVFGILLAYATGCLVWVWRETTIAIQQYRYLSWKEQA